MPNKDGTGPEGKGPRTGRQLGDCGNAKPQEETRKGFGRRFNRPRRCRRFE